MLQIGICDDETVIAARMEELIFETCRAEGIQAGVEVFYSGNTLLEEVRRGTRYDLLYLDIHMQKGNGHHPGYNSGSRCPICICGGKERFHGKRS